MTILNIRNLCIIAHVDHGKTTLIDHLFRQTGSIRESKEERIMDSGTLEKERGITIQAKNAAMEYKGTKINIIDTPGHADFGGEVERVLSMADGSILLVDAVEGPLPQTRFVMQKAINHGHKFILCINKVDRPELEGSSRIKEVIDKTFDLFIELGASDDQCEFPIVYACARKGWCTERQEDIDGILAGTQKADLMPIFDLIIDTIPSPRIEENTAFRMLISNLFYSDYLGQIAVGRILSGKIKPLEKIYRQGVDSKGNPISQGFSVSKILTFKGLEQIDVPQLDAGDIGLIAGCEDFQIGDTLTNDDTGTPLPRISVEIPTMSMVFSINNSPLAGKEGEAIQSRKLAERLVRECRKNVAFSFKQDDPNAEARLLGRGELQFGVLIDEMRREGLEFMVGRPTVLLKKDEITGELQEPFEQVTMDLPQVFSGDVTELMQSRKGVLQNFETLMATSEGQRVRLTFQIPTRGMLGIRSTFLTLTKGQGIYSSEFLRYDTYKGQFFHRQNGSIIADRSGKTNAYALSSLEDRGVLFYGPGVEIYEGMIIGEHSRENDINVYANREKKMTNVRTTSSDGLTILAGIRKMTLERCLEYIEDDEWLEITPKNFRMRKKILSSGQRSVIRNKIIE